MIRKRKEKKILQKPQKYKLLRDKEALTSY